MKTSARYPTSARYFGQLKEIQGGIIKTVKAEPKPDEGTLLTGYQLPHFRMGHGCLYVCDGVGKAPWEICCCCVYCCLLFEALDGACFDLNCVSPNQ